MCTNIKSGLFCIAMVLLLLQCSKDATLTGIIEVGNPEKVTGVLTDTLNQPAAGIALQLISTDYNPVLSGESSLSKKISADQNALVYVDTTDSQGRFSFTVVSDSQYNLIAVATEFHLLIYMDSIAVDSDSIDLGTVAMTQPDTVQITIDSASFTNGYVVVPGSYIRVTVDSAGTLPVLVPQGVRELLYINSSGEKIDTLKAAHFVTMPHTPTVADTVFVNVPTVFKTGGSFSNYGQPIEYRFIWVNYPYDWSNPDSITSWGIDSTVSLMWSSELGRKIRAQARSAIDTAVVSELSPYIRFDVIKP